MNSYIFFTCKYILSRNFLYNFLEIGHKGKYGDARRRFNEDVLEKYNHDVGNFKKLMSGASREFWKCDRYIIKGISKSGISPDSYHELKAFTILYVYVNSLHDYLNCSPKECPEMECKINQDNCVQIRHCPTKLNGCERIRIKTSTPGLEPGHYPGLTIYSSEAHYACANETKNAYKRYTSVIPGDKGHSIVCPAGTRREVFMSSMISILYTDYYICTCTENHYFISLAAVNATKDHVIVGARFEIHENTLYVRIKEGKLMPNGTIDIKTVRWNDNDMASDGEKMRIDLNTEIDLKSTYMFNHRVMTGLKFERVSPTPNAKNKRVYIAFYGTKYDFTSGSLEGDTAEVIHELATNYLNISDADAPLKSNKPNNIYSGKNDYIKISLSSMEKDGSQTTIPFIDTQDVIPNPPVPLSGIGMYLRRQEGFGGFLGLKLITYNVEPHIQISKKLDFDIDYTGKSYLKTNSEPNLNGFFSDDS